MTVALVVLLLVSRAQLVVAERAWAQFPTFHQLIHEFRDELVKSAIERARADERRKGEWVGKMMRSILDKMESIFTALCDKPCHASVMFLREGSPDKLVTVDWSHGVSVERQERPTELTLEEPRQGIAVTAFLSGVPQICPDVNAPGSGFVSARADHQKYYNSVISSPFKIDGQIKGVMNIDSIDTGIFDDTMKWVAQMGGDLIAAILQIRDRLSDESQGPDPV